MSNLYKIADAKIQAAITRRIAHLNTEKAAVIHEMNRRGVLHSSMAVLEIHNKWLKLFDQIQSDMEIEYGVVLDNVYWPNERLHNLLIDNSRDHFDSLRSIAKGEIEGATKSLLNSNLHVQLTKDFTESHDRALTNISLFIDGHSSIQRRKRILSIAEFLPNQLLKIFKQ